MHCKVLVSNIVPWKIMEQSKFHNILILIQVMEKDITEKSNYVLVA